MQTPRGRTKWTAESVLQSSRRTAHKMTEAEVAVAIRNGSVTPIAPEMVRRGGKRL